MPTDSRSVLLAKTTHTSLLFQEIEGRPLDVSNVANSDSCCCMDLDHALLFNVSYYFLSENIFSTDRVGGYTTNTVYLRREKNLEASLYTADISYPGTERVEG